MFERFTERAREVVVLAQDEARALKHNYIGTEHLLLGLLRAEGSLAASVLESFDITVEEVRVHVARIVGQGDELATGQIPFTPRSKTILEFSLREAFALGHNYIGPEHLLLGLARENEGVAARILLTFDVDDERIRNETIRMLRREQALSSSEPTEAGLTEAFLELPSRRTVRLLDVVQYPPELYRTLLMIVCGLSAAALAVGILLGWLIWG